jgi:2-polyprenyl-6-methoxyphenol hydroxylase-like FAD-dependent oxidoreductase
MAKKKGRASRPYPESIPRVDLLRVHPTYAYGYYTGIADAMKLCEEVMRKTSPGEHYLVVPQFKAYFQQATTEMAVTKTQEELF